MKIILTLGFSILFLAACGNSIKPTNVSQQQNSTNSLTVTSHSSDPAPTAVSKSDTKTKWTQSGDPIDTSEFDAEVKQAETNFKTKPKGEAAKKSLADAYFRRAVALTGARQYASALGDYRRTLKLDPGNKDAKDGMDQITSIYESLNRDYPKEGEEPPPLPFRKE